MVPYSAIATYGFSVVPLFLIMGSFLSRAGLVSDLFRMAKLWVGNIPGSLVHATIVAGSLFAAAFGSGLAATTALATVCVPEMRKGGVDKVLACGTVASVGPIDQIPLEWCYGDGVVLDFHYKKKGEGITAEDVKKELQRIGYKIKAFDIVLIRTDMYKHYDEPGYEEMHPGMTREATLWILNQGVKVTGTDAWGWTDPLK